MKKSALLLAVAALVRLVVCSPVRPGAAAAVTAADRQRSAEHDRLLQTVGDDTERLPKTPLQKRREGLPASRLAHGLTTQDLEHSHRKREASPSSATNLSIVNPLNVLRRRVILEMMRRRMRKNRQQIRENSEILSKIGKRSTRTQMTLLRQQAIEDSFSQQTEEESLLS